MKRLSLILCFVLLLAGCVSADGEARGSRDEIVSRNRPITVCYSSVSGTQSVAMYAYEKGIYADYGLDVNLLYIEGGSRATSALIAGEVDICQIAGSAIVNGVVAGTDLALIAGLFNTYVYSLMVKPEIQSAADLKGQALAISSPGGSSDTAMRTVVRSLGLEPDDDVAILSIGGQSKRLAAMETGAVVGTIVSVPQTALARELGYFEMVNMADLEVPFQHTAIATSRSFIESDRDVVVRFLQATIAAIAQMKEDREGVVNVLADYLLLDAEEDAVLLQEAADVLIKDYLPDMPYPTVDGVQAQLDALVTENAAAANYSAADIIDSTLLQEIEQSGFRESLQR